MHQNMNGFLCSKHRGMSRGREPQLQLHLFHAITPTTLFIILVFNHPYHPGVYIRSTLYSLTESPIPEPP